MSIALSQMEPPRLLLGCSNIPWFKTCASGGTTALAAVVAPLGGRCAVALAFSRFSAGCQRQSGFAVKLTARCSQPRRLMAAMASVGAELLLDLPGEARQKRRGAVADELDAMVYRVLARVGQHSHVDGGYCRVPRWPVLG